MKSHLLSAAALAVAALCVSAPTRAAIALTMTPSATHINTSQSVTIDVGITGLGSEILSGFDLNFVYNASVLSLFTWSFSAAEFGDPNTFPYPIGETGGPGNLGYDIISLDDDATIAGYQTNDTFRLFSFVFTGTADGTTQFTLGSGLNDRLFLGSFGTNGEPTSLEVGISSLCIGVGSGSCDGGPSIPEPASYGLAAVALLAAGVAGRKRRTPAMTA